MTWLVVAVLLAVACVPLLLMLSPDRPWAAPALVGVVLTALVAGAKSYWPVLEFVTPRLQRSVTASARVVEVSSDRTQSGMTRAVVAFIDSAGFEHRRRTLTMAPLTLGQQLTIRHDPTDASWAMPDNAAEIAFYRWAKPIVFFTAGTASLVLAISLLFV